MPNKEKKIAIYCRVARVDGVSLKRQMRTVVQFAVDEGYNGIYIYLDNGEGGHHVNRPAFTQLNNDMLAGKVQTVVVKDLSRIARNFILVDRWMNMADALDVEIISMANDLEVLKETNQIYAAVSLLSEFLEE